MIFYSVFINPLWVDTLTVKNPYEVYTFLMPICEQYGDKWHSIQTNFGEAIIYGKPHYNSGFGDWEITGYFPRWS